MKFDKLEILNLGWNQISYIKVLEKVKFDKLEILNLGWNQISDIKVLEKVKFDKLKKLYLFWNRISEKENETIIEKLKSKLKGGFKI